MPVSCADVPLDPIAAIAPIQAGHGSSQEQELLEGTNRGTHETPTSF